MLRNFLMISLTYNMSVICCNSREVKTCWKCIHLFKLVSTKRLYGCYAKHYAPRLQESMGIFLFRSIKMKKTEIFPHKVFCLYVSQSDLISRNLLCPEKLLGTHLVDHHGWLTKERLGIHSFNDFILSNLSILLKLIFHSHDT